MSDNWNSRFTQLLRGNHPSYWGNWTLDARIEPGAVGILDPLTGSFRYVANLPNARTSATSSARNNWKVQSSTVKETQGSVDLHGSGVDPETDTEIEAGAEITFSFSEAGSISSTFTLDRQIALADFAAQIAQNMDWLKRQAGSVNMAIGSKITQGFGVITSVLSASSGLNLGAQTADSSFSIEGTASGTNAMAGNPQGSGKGSFALTRASAAFESHLWPARPNTRPGGPIPIAFEFASFAGDQIMVGWVQNVSALNIFLANNHGGTYVVVATATYNDGGVTHSTSRTVSGGLVATMDPIPPTATNLRLDVNFKGFTDEHHTLGWPTPIGVFSDGHIDIDLFGVWPSAGSVKVVSTGEQA